MSSAISAGDFVTTLANYKIEKATPGSETTVKLKSPLPDDIVQSLNAGHNVYAILGCRRNGRREHVLIKKNGYSATDQTLRLIRGQASTAVGLNGESFEHTGNSIELNFNVINAASFKEILDTIKQIQENINSYIQENSPQAEKTKTGLIQTSWDNPTKPASVPYQAITKDNPLMQDLIRILFSLPSGSATLEFNGQVQPIVYDRLAKIADILSILDDNTKFNAFKTFLQGL